MKKVFYNILVNHSRYRRLVVIMSVFVAGIVIASILIPYRSLEARKAEISPEAYIRQKKQADSKAFVNMAFGLLMIAMMGIMSETKRNTRIITDKDGILYKSGFRKTFIPWDNVKDLKLVQSGTAHEKCRVKAGDREIAFTAFFVDMEEKYQVKGDGIFDCHGKAVTPQVRKSKLYKEISRWTGKE